MYKEKVCSVGMTLILFWITQLSSFQRPQNVWLIGKVIWHNKQLTFVLIITFQWYWAWLSTCIMYHNPAHKIFSHDHCQPLSRVCSVVWGHYWHSLWTSILYKNYQLFVYIQSSNWDHYWHSLCTFIMHIHYAYSADLCYELSVLLIIIHAHYQLTAEFWISIALAVF